MSASFSFDPWGKEPPDSEDSPQDLHGAQAAAQGAGSDWDAEEAAMNAARAHRDRVAQTLARLRADDEARVRFQAERAAAEQTPPFDAGLLSDILARPEAPAHRAKDIIPADAGTLIVAQRKTGKTTLQLNLANCLISGGAFLGRFDVTPVEGRVAFLNYEVSAAQLARWAADVGIPDDRLFLVNLRGRRNPLANPGDREALADKLRTLNVESIFVDPFGRAFTGTNQNDPGEVGAYLADLDRFGRGDVGARDIILAAHAGWNGERSRGSTALEDWADSIITITRGDDHTRYLRAEGRDVSIDEDELTHDPDARTLTLAGSGSRKAAARTRHLDALAPVVLDLLRESPALSGNQLDTAIKKLISDGDLDAKHSKGDGARAAQILERTERGALVVSKEGPRKARLFSLNPAMHHNPTSPTSPDLPTGNSCDFPHLPYRGEVAQGSHNTPPPPPTQGTHTTKDTP